MKRYHRLFFAAAVAVAALSAFPVTAGAIPRDVAVARGFRWVNYIQSRDASGRPLVYGVPYSQSRYAREDGSSVGTHSAQGYRTDCSGFVSMCLNLRYTSGAPYSATTRIFATNPSKYYQITKDQLQPGDFMLASDVWGSSGPHAALFIGWANEAKTQYWTVEQTTTKDHNGTIHRIRDYPGPYYRPYRYAGIQDDFADVLDRVSGDDRYEVAVNGSLASYPASTTTSVPALVVASGLTWPDALGGSALAGASGGPLLLTASDSLPASTGAEISRLKPKYVYLLGGEGTVTQNVVAAIERRGPKVVRLGGADRYVTASLAASQAVHSARAAGRVVDTAYIATGRDYPDALAVSPISAKTMRPVLLTEVARLTPATRNTLKSLGIKKVIVLGGTASVSEAVVTALKADGVTVTRIDGRDRYECGAAIADHGATLGMKWTSLGIASGTGFADALAGGVTQGKANSLLVLTRPDLVPTPVLNRVTAHKTEIGRPRVYGGYASVWFGAREDLALVFRTVAK